MPPVLRKEVDQRIEEKSWPLGYYGDFGTKQIATMQEVPHTYLTQWKKYNSHKKTTNNHTKQNSLSVLMNAQTYNYWGGNRDNLKSDGWWYSSQPKVY